MLNRKSFLGVVLGATMLLGTTAITFASGSSITCYHGNKPSDLKVGGNMVSTAKESSLRVDTKYRLSGSAAENFRTGSPSYNSKTAENWVYVGTNSGDSYCYYYANGQKYHESTAWFSFNY